MSQCHRLNEYNSLFFIFVKKPCLKTKEVTIIKFTRCKQTDFFNKQMLQKKSTSWLFINYWIWKRRIHNVIYSFVHLLYFIFIMRVLWILPNENQLPCMHAVVMKNRNIFYKQISGFRANDNCQTKTEVLYFQNQSLFAFVCLFCNVDLFLLVIFTFSGPLGLSVLTLYSETKFRTVEKGRSRQGYRICNYLSGTD